MGSVRHVDDVLATSFCLPFARPIPRLRLRTALRPRARLRAPGRDGVCAVMLAGVGISSALRVM
jgi:hypothetical protein